MGFLCCNSSIKDCHISLQLSQPGIELWRCHCHLPGGRLGRAIAEIGVTAVDADPRQLLLLAVTGGGTAAGQQDAQDHTFSLNAEPVFEALVGV